MLNRTIKSLIMKITTTCIIIASLLVKVYSAIYNDDGVTSLTNGKVIYEEDAIPSKLSCVQKCHRLQTDSIYDGNVCKCIKQFNESNENSHETVSGHFIESQGELDKKRYNFLIEHAIVAQKGRLIATISKLTKEYRMVINFKCNCRKFPKGTIYNLFWIKKGKETTYGRNQPKVNLFRDNDNYCKIRIRSPFNDEVQITEARYNPDDITKLEILQRKTKNGYRYQVIRNGITVNDKKNNENPRDFENMNVYVSSPLSEAAGEILNFWIEGAIGMIKY